MRPHRILVVLAITLGLWAPREAAARCSLFGPYLGTGPQLPQGCPLHVYMMLVPGGGIPRQVTVLRGGQYVDVTGAAIPEPTQLRVKHVFTDCGGVERTQESMESYDRWEIQPVGVNVGERIGLGSGWVGGIEIVAPAACPAPLVPMPSCTDLGFCNVPPPFEDFGPGGCAAGGGAGAAIGLAGLALLGRRRRRRR
jgi:MYXO-CTERM domain-containing protein